MLIARRARRLSGKVYFRTLTVFTLFAVLVPLIVIDGKGRASASASVPAEAPPNNAPPQEFKIGEPVTRSRIMDAASYLGKEIGEVVHAPELPEEFRAAKLPTFAERLAAKLSAPLAMLNAAKSGPAGNGETPPACTSSPVDFDFDGDKKADVSRWRGTGTEFKIRNSNGGAYSTYTIGSATAKPAPADYDGDGKTDAAVFDAGTWTIRKSSNGTTETIAGFGQAGDIPASGNYRTAASADELAFYRPSNGTWYWREFASPTVYSQGYGVSTDIPAAGDYDGNGIVEPAVYRAGTWWISGIGAISWGLSSDVPVPADYS